MAKPGSKDSWGPKLWRVLHNLAWLSDRTDLPFLWKKVLKSLTEVMPCPICRAHLAEYIQNHALFTIKNLHLVKGPEVKERMIYNIWMLHNSVNQRNGKPEFPLELLKALYVDKNRSELISETGRTLRDINGEWEPIVLQQITGAAFREWRNDTTLIMGLISGGPN